jgi:hypothetical protein
MYPPQSRRPTVAKTLKQIKKSRDNYLQWACILRDDGDYPGYLKYLAHVEGMNYLLNLRKYGSALVF